MNIPQIDFVKLSVWLRRNARPHRLLPIRAGVSFSAKRGASFVKDVSKSSRLFCVRRILSAARKLGCVAVLVAAGSGLTSLLLAQTTIGTGSIVGTVSDPSGACLLYTSDAADE